MNAIINSGPREDSTRIGRAGTVRRQAVDVSPLRRVNQVYCAASQYVHTVGLDWALSFLGCVVGIPPPLLLELILVSAPPQAIWLLCTGAREAAFRNIKTIAECLADELINAAKVGALPLGQAAEAVVRAEFSAQCWGCPTWVRGTGCDSQLCCLMQLFPQLSIVVG